MTDESLLLEISREVGRRKDYFEDFGVMRREGTWEGYLTIVGQDSDDCPTFYAESLREVLVAIGSYLDLPVANPSSPTLDTQLEDLVQYSGVTGFSLAYQPANGFATPTEEWEFYGRQHGRPFHASEEKLAQALERVRRGEAMVSSS